MDFEKSDRHSKLLRDKHTLHKANFAKDKKTHEYKWGISPRVRAPVTTNQPTQLQVCRNVAIVVVPIRILEGNCRVQK